MNKREASIAMENGMKVKIVGWLPTSYIYQNLNTGEILGNTGCRYDLQFVKENEVFEYYEEPKRKVKYAPAIFRFAGDNYYLWSMAMYSSEKDAREHCGNKFIQMDWGSAVEVDE